ncbi:hypothetical protein Acr_00g0058370 [Actinidia rufa]|uniref:GRAS family transcription factor n=1 Tax=Actinidia rufa TaxID=165716 RepID=A0A7J0DN14_9ERIC|nr:hypothetical protein Acr_00g0058370 [Actinidia rufa]
MMQPELLEQLSWPYHNIINSSLDQEFSFSFSNTEDSYSSGISSDQFLFTDEFVEYLMSGDEFQVTDGDYMEGLEPILGGDQLGDVCRWLREDESEGSFPSPNQCTEPEDIWSPSQSTKSSEVSLTLPGGDMDIDSHLSLGHLLKAYGQAMEMEQRELAEVIRRRIMEKVSPVGETLERLGFHLFQSVGMTEEEHLLQESSKNFKAVFKAFYQIFPYGKLAHFTANLAILEAVPENIETIHIVDFDVGEGVQWAPMIESVASLRKTLRLTLIKSGEDLLGEATRRLYDHARSSGLNMKVEEVGIEDLVSGIKKMKNRGGRREWLAFNCMVGLPHMRKGRSRSHVREFLRKAKELLANSENNEGIIVIGDGDAGERLRSCSGYGSFFEGYLSHYQALCESMEWNVAVSLAEARIAMESLFVAPFISSPFCLRKWEEVREGSDLYAEIGLNGQRLTKENLVEAQEMVREGESLYVVTIGGQNNNEMVLEWRGNPLVRVSTWR